MKKERTTAFYGLLHDIEYTIGNQCYNGNIQNYGSNGIWKGEGRSFRYPIRFINKKMEKETYRSRIPYTESAGGEMANCILGEHRYESAHYAFGANELHILKGIRMALEDVEKRFGLDFDELLKIESERKKSNT